MSWADAFDRLGRRIASSHELRALGATERSLTIAVRGGHLIRVRRDHYALPGTGRAILEAVRVGGRIACISALAERGVFTVDALFTHVHLDRGASRLRHPRDRFVRLADRERDGVELHWSPLRFPAGSECSVDIHDALAQAVRCIHPWHAVAAIDSALHLGEIDQAGLNVVFAAAPGALRGMRDAVDGRAESGSESLLRMIVREAGLRYELQRWLPGVGRVDMIVEDRVVLEADSRLAHDGWTLHVRDRDRDLGAARLGYASLRPVYQRILSTPLDVRDAVLGLLRGRR